MAIKAQLWTMSGLATELGMDRRKVGNALSGVKPDGKSGRSDTYLMKTAVRALFSRGDESFDLTEERARLAKEQADRTEMENSARRGELLDRGLVDQAVVAAFARVRARLLSVPTKCAPHLMPERPAEAEAIVREQIYAALRELSETNIAQLADDHEGMVENADAPAGPDGL